MCLNDIMPKKTKRQKIAAEVHKHRIIEQTAELKESVSSQQAESPTHRAQKKALFTSEYTTFFKHDLIKSLLITGVLLAVELGIFIAQQNGLSFNIKLPF